MSDTRARYFEAQERLWAAERNADLFRERYELAKRAYEAERAAERTRTTEQEST